MDEHPTILLGYVPGVGYFVSAYTRSIAVTARDPEYWRAKERALLLLDRCLNR